MTRVIGPDQQYRVFYYTSGRRAGELIPPGTSVPLYSDAAGTLPADVVDLSSVAIPGSPPTVYVGDTYEVPQFKYPDGLKVVYTRVLGGPVVPLYALADDRLDVLEAAVSGGVVTSADLAAHAADTTAIHGIADTSVLETTTGAQTKATAAQTAAITAAGIAAVALVDDLSGVTDLPLARTALRLGGAASLNAGTSGRKVKILTHVTSMQTGHGWTASGALSSNLNDTSDYAMGSQSAIITSKTDTTAATLTKTGLSLDLSGSKQLRLLLKITGGDYISQCLLYWSSDGFAANYGNANIQGPNADPSVRWFKNGEWHWITINVGSAAVTNNGVLTGTPSLAAITDLRIRLVSTSGQSISARLQAVQVVERRAFAAGGVVCFTYDDSYRAQSTIAAPHLDKYGWPATAYTITENVENGDAGNTTYLTTAMLQALRKNNRWEISLHTDRIANHARAFAAATSAQGVVYGTNPLSVHELDVDIDANLNYLIGNGLADGFPGHCYPQGRYDTAVAEQMAKRTSYARAMTGNSNGMETIPPANVYAIRSYVLDNTTTYAYLQTIIDAVATYGGLAVFTCHDIVTTPTTSTQFSTAIHQQLVDYVATKSGIRVMTLADVVKANASQDAIVGTSAGTVAAGDDSRIVGALQSYGAPQAKSANFTAVAGVIYLVDTTAGSVTCTLPSANVAGQQLVIKNNAGANSVVVNRAGSDLIGSATTVSLTLASEIWELESSGAGVWTVIGNGKGLASLDARYYTDLAPADIGMLAWTHNPAITNTVATAFTTGRLLLMRLKRVPAGTITNIGTLIVTAGVSLTSGQCFAALYKPDRTRVGITADQAVAWGTAGTKTMPLTTPYVNPAVSDLIIGWWANGTTSPLLGRMANNNTTLFNNTLTEGNYISALADTGLTTAAPDPYGTTSQGQFDYYWNLS